MKTYQMEGRVTALSSISHNGGQSFGINAKLRREKFATPRGTVEEVPVVSGNSIRGILRDRGMLHMCRALGYGDEGDQVRGLTLPAFHFLFGGGSLTSDGGKALDLDRARQLRQKIPLAGIFGGAVGNQILPGKLKCGKMIPLCAETAHLLPEQFRGSLSIWDLTQEEMYVRKDDEKNEHLRQTIAAPARTLLDIARARKAETVKPEVKEETGASQQMMYYVETFCAGTQFYWRVVLDDVTDIEFEAFLVALGEFSRQPYIGGKSNVGMGEVAIRFDQWVALDSRLSAPGSGVSMPSGHAYQAHLTEEGDAIRDLLGAMA